jgi:hypothetical protein
VDVVVLWIGREPQTRSQGNCDIRNIADGPQDLSSTARITQMSSASGAEGGKQPTGRPAGRLKASPPPLGPTEPPRPMLGVVN